MLRIGLIAAALAIVAFPVAARDCAPARNLPPGVRQLDRPGCAPKPPQAEKAKSTRDGFVDLGNGTEIRVNGRVRIEGRALR